MSGMNHDARTEQDQEVQRGSIPPPDMGSREGLAGPWSPWGSSWIAAIQVANVLTSRIEADMHRRGGVTPFEFQLLATLRRQPDEVPMSQVAHLVDSSLSRLSHVVRRLEGRGWVTRRTSPDDARVTLVGVTPEGLVRFEAAEAPYRRLMDEAFLGHLTPEEHAEYARLSLKLLRGLRPEHWYVQWVDQGRESDVPS